ncbi:MAG: ABC transporter ATP-binding protein [Planctomycetes bacterium]|nr:ABC transporter ATP-binding protein [Planctomycetota bacterium]
MAVSSFSSPRPPLHAAGLSKSYRTSRRSRVDALADFTLRCEPAAHVGLLGPNGAGKTTAIQLLLGLEAPDRGGVELFGLPPTDRRARARIGYLPEESALFGFLDADETLHLAGRLHGMDRPARRRRVEELISRLGLAGARRRRVATYSRGMARRLAFARAVVHAPQLLVLDEPTAGLDPEGGALVFALMEECRSAGTAVLFSTHLLREAEARCSELVILVGGRIAAAGLLDELLGPVDPVLGIRGLEPAARDELVAWVNRQGGRVETEASRRRSLERLFLSLAGEPS